MRRLLTLVVFAALAAGSVVAQNKPQKTEFFPLDQVKPGMRATGYTVFAGSEPKPFELEILGLIKGFQFPQQSAVLSRLLGSLMSRPLRPSIAISSAIT